MRPELVVEVSFTAWSGEGRVRHPVYYGFAPGQGAGRGCTRPTGFCCLTGWR
ncbi:hypothetical protein [Acidisoma sp. S159]|uniref:hypothetical protein n=1 Tax=Acidisoma sp. S159 TaxID=1747225 RepID=UPI00352B7967